MHKKSDFLCLILLSLILGFFAGFIKISSPDIFWHIKVGSFINNQSFFPKINSFSWCFNNHCWYSTYWFFSKLIALIFERGGYTALSVFKIILTSTIAVLFSISLYRRNNSIVVSLLLLITFVDISLFRLILRPHLVTFLGMTILLYNEKKIFTCNLPKKDLINLCIIFTLWANLHSGVIFGLLMVTISLFAGLIIIKQKLMLRSCYLLLFIIATFLNPNGPKYFLYLFDHLNMDQYIFIDELAPLTFKNNLRYLYLLSFLYIIPFFTEKNKKESLIYLLLILPINFYFLAKGKRFIPITVIFISLPWLYFKITVSEIFKVNKNLLLIIVSTIYLLSLHTIKINKNIEISSGIGLNYSLFPVRETKVLENNNIAKIFNSIGIGGFLMKESRIMPFIDGRIHAYPFSLYKEIYRSNYSKSQFMKFLNKWEFDAVLVDVKEYYISEKFFDNNWNIKFTKPFFLAIKDK